MTSTTRHAASLRLTGPLIAQDDGMTQGSNAGIKRVRRARGLPVVERKVRQVPSTAAMFDEACRQSGNLSLSLYLERLAAALVQEHGSLPVLSPTLDGIGEVTTTAA